MKYLVILMDGMADYPVPELGGKTPMEVAAKPNIDALAAHGMVGTAKTVPDSLKPGSDVANLAVMGFDPERCYSGRSPLEAISIGVDMADTDVAIRCNLVTLSDEPRYEDRSMVDYSSGELDTATAAALIDYLKANLSLEGMDLYSGVSYRHCLIWHNGNSDISFTPPHDISGRKIADYLPKGEYGELFLQLQKRSAELLKDHPLNVERRRQGKNPATSMWLWGNGTKPKIPEFRAETGLNGAVISAVDLLKGIGIAAGMRSYDVPGATGNIDTNFRGKAETVVQAFEDGADYVYLHMEAPDECGHQGNAALKTKSIEMIDEIVVSYLVEEMNARGWDYRILLCPDHPTPIVTRTHARDPIPFMVYDSTTPVDGVATLTEKTAAATGLYLPVGYKLRELLLNSK